MCALKASMGFGGHDQALWPEPHHGCSCLQLCYHARYVCLAMWSALQHEPDVSGAQTWLITRALPHPLDSQLNQATISSLPSSLHLMCCSGALVNETLALVTLVSGDQSPLVAPWQIKENSICFTTGKITSAWIQTPQPTAVKLLFQ